MMEFGTQLKLYYYTIKYQGVIRPDELAALSKNKRDYLHALVKLEIFCSVCHLHECEAKVRI
jgi:hypothetical protein